MTLSLHHAAITTDRFDALVSFYTDVLGAKLLRRMGWDAGEGEFDAIVGLQDSSCRIAMLDFGNACLEIFEFAHPTPDKREATTLAHLGITHIALSCADCRAEYDRLCAAGMRFNAPPGPTPAGGWFTYGYDPDGNIVELLQPPPADKT